MSIQRTRYQIVTYKDETEENQGAVVLEVQFKGTCEDRSDALLMIADAWDDAMKEHGLDSLKSLIAFQKNGQLQ